MQYQNTWNRNRNPKRYCSVCGVTLNPHDKGRSHDHGLMENKIGYPRPLCYNDAYFYASKYIEEHLEELIKKNGGKNHV